MSEEVKQNVVEAAPEPTSSETTPAPEIAPEAPPAETPAPTPEVAPHVEEAEKEKTKEKKEKKDGKMRFGLNFPHMKNPLKSDKKSDAAHTTTPAVPAYRFISTMQGHGYPVVPTAPASATSPPATAAPEVAESKTRGIKLPGIMHINKKKAATPASAAVARTPEVPAYRFISTMAGYGYPHVAAEKPVPVPVAEKKKWTSLIPTVKGRRPSKENILVEPTPAPVAEVAPVPAYRFISTMQGHGYPVIPATPVEVTPLEPKKKTSATSLFGGFVGKVKALGGHKEAGEEEGTSAVVKEVEVPAYRFITSMQGHGYPIMPTPTPACPEASKPKRTASNVREKIAGLGHRLTAKRLRGDKEEKTQKEEVATVAVAEPTVPAYRFIASMQGHGYPVTPVAATEVKEEAKAESKKEEKRGILHTLTKRLTFKKKKSQDVPQEAAAPKEEAQVEVPAHRFLVSMQGHGYPVVPTVAAPEPAKETPAPAQEKETIEQAPKPNHTQSHQAQISRFVSTQEAETATPTPAPATEEKKKEEEGMGRRLIRSFTGMFRRDKKHAAPVQPVEVAAA